VTGGEPVRLLFVCWGNSARSLLGEALLRHLGGDRVEVHSAGGCRFDATSSSRSPSGSLRTDARWSCAEPPVMIGV
jgi:protein-tyrosine-phosphatase